MEEQICTPSLTNARHLPQETEEAPSDPPKAIDGNFHHTSNTLELGVMTWVVQDECDRGVWLPRRLLGVAICLLCTADAPRLFIYLGFSMRLNFPLLSVNQ